EDEDKWEKAKEAASKTYDEGDPAYWPVVATIYENMGGAIKGKEPVKAQGSREAAFSGHANRKTEMANEASKDANEETAKANDADEDDPDNDGDQHHAAMQAHQDAHDSHSKAYDAHVKAGSDDDQKDHHKSHMAMHKAMAEYHGEKSDHMEASEPLH